MAYNPYNRYKEVLGYKADWHTAQQQGYDPNQYYQAAMPAYKELYDNGYGELADDLANSNYIQAKGLADKYGLKPDEQFGLDNDFNAVSGNAYNLTQKASDIVNGSYANDSYIDKMVDAATGVGGMAQGAYDLASGIASMGVTPQTQSLLDAYNGENNRLNGEIRYDAAGNVVSGLNTSHYNTGRNQLDYYNNFDITKQPYYEGIMSAYQLNGQNAANNAYANGASNNGGNIDSYAAANANRQQLAFTNAGQQAALAVAQQNAANWNNLYAQMSDDLYKQGSLSLQTLGIARDMYATDAQERMNALDTTGALASAQMENALNTALAMIDERVKDKGITADMAMKEADIAAKLEEVEKTLANELAIQEGINETNRYTSDNNLRGTMYTSDNDLRGTMYKADTDLLGTYDTNAANRDIAGINANATLGSANIRANADMYNADQDYAARVYAADRNYDSAYLDTLSAKELAELNNNHALTLARENNANALKVAQVNAAAKNGTTGAGTDWYSDYDETQMSSILWDSISGGDADTLATLGFDGIRNSVDIFNVLKGFGKTDAYARKVIKELNEDAKVFGYKDLNTYLAGIYSEAENGTTSKKNSSNPLIYEW